MLGIGTKRTIYIGGRAIPATQVGETFIQPVTLPNGRVLPNAQFAELLSLRETNPALGPVQQYLTVTIENLRFSTLRFEPVVGLDVDENGALLSIEELEAMRGEAIAARQLARATAQAPAVIALDTAEDD